MGRLPKLRAWVCISLPYFSPAKSKQKAFWFCLNYAVLRYWPEDLNRWKVGEVALSAHCWLVLRSLRRIEGSTCGTLKLENLRICPSTSLHGVLRQIRTHSRAFLFAEINGVVESVDGSMLARFEPNPYTACEIKGRFFSEVWTRTP